ncbi:MAG: hypothetical protein IKO93_10025 [Lentisphaeria bacterium]|nr:hypothetical protein [Lentisphaeria bacterium]
MKIDKAVSLCILPSGAVFFQKKTVLRLLFHAKQGKLPEHGFISQQKGI